MHAAHVPFTCALYVPAWQAVHVGLLDPPHTPVSCWPAGHDARHAEHTRSDVAVAGWETNDPDAHTPEMVVQTVLCVVVQADAVNVPEPHTAQSRHWPDAESAYWPALHEDTHWPFKRNLPAAHCTHAVGLVHTLHDDVHSWHTELESL